MHRDFFHANMGRISFFVDAGREGRLCMCFGFEIEWPHWWVVIVSCFFLTPPCHTFSDFQCCIGSLFKHSSKNLKATLNTESFWDSHKTWANYMNGSKTFCVMNVLKKATRRPHSFDKICFKEMFFFFICFFCRELRFKGKLNLTGSLGWAGKGMKKEVLDDFEDVEPKKQHCMLGMLWAHSRRLHLTHFNKISPSIPCLVGSKNLPFQPSKKDYKATDGPWFVCVADSEDLEGNSLRQTTRWGNEGVGHTVLECSISPRVWYRHRSFL